MESLQRKQTMLVPVEAGQVKVQEEINFRSSVTSGEEARMLYTIYPMKGRVYQL